MSTHSSRVGTELVQAFALPGCSRLTTVGFGLLLAWTFTTPASRWAGVPFDLETAARPAALDPVRTEVESLLAGRSWGDAPMRSRVARAILEESRAAELDPLMVLAVIQVESEAQADAISSRGALGLMQLRPPTLRFIAETEGLGLSAAEPAVLCDPAINVRLGIRYLHRLRKAFGDMGVALVAYNAGPHRVSGYLHAGQPIPDSLRGYPHRVRRAYLRLVRQLGEDQTTADNAFPLSPEVALR